MKQREFNSFERALAEGDGSLHPDADVLNAFAEGTLLPRERERVFGHVARCAECRQVLSLATESAQETEPMKPFLVASARRPSLRILVPTLAAAAAIIVVSAVVVRYQLTQRTHSVAVAAKPPEEKAVQPALGGSAKAQASPTKPEQYATPKITVHGNAEAGAARVAPSPSQPLPHPAPPADSNATASSEIVPSAPPARKQDPGAAQARAASPLGSFASAGVSRPMAPSMQAIVARPHWRIDEQGQPERSINGGAWQPVPPGQNEKMHVVAVYGGEVWVGGENSQVFRSYDNGATWRNVPLPDPEGRTRTIVHIRFDSAQDIAIESGDGTSWTTLDGGESWKREIGRERNPN